jgi:hypothetical protein
VIEIWVVEGDQRRRAYTYADVAAMLGRPTHTARFYAARDKIRPIDYVVDIPVFYPEQFGIEETG